MTKAPPILMQALQRLSVTCIRHEMSAWSALVLPAFLASPLVLPSTDCGHHTFLTVPTQHGANGTPSQTCIMKKGKARSVGQGYVCMLASADLTDLASTLWVIKYCLERIQTNLLPIHVKIRTTAPHRGSPSLLGPATLMKF